MDMKEVEYLYRELDKCIEHCTQLENECADGKDDASAMQYQAMADAYKRVRYNIVPCFEKLNQLN